MQLFVNNWSTALIASLSASDELLSVAPDAAARLADIGGGNYYLLTLSAVDEQGQEAAWEIVKATAAAGGAITIERAQEGTTAADWSAGAAISARLTAGWLARGMANPLIESGDLLVGGAGGAPQRLPLGAPGQVPTVNAAGDGIEYKTPAAGGGRGDGLTRANLIDKLEGGYAGQSPNLFWADADLGAYARFDFGRTWGWAKGDTFADASEDPDWWDAWHEYAEVTGRGAGAEIVQLFGGSVLSTGTAPDGLVMLTVGPPPPGIFAPQATFLLGVDPIAEIDARLCLRLPTAANGTDDFDVEASLSVAGLGVIWFKQSRGVNSGNLTVTYKNSNNSDVVVNTTRKIAAFDNTFGVRVTPSGEDYTVEFNWRPNSFSDTGLVVMSSLLASAMAKSAVQFGYTAMISKLAGTTSRGLRVKRFAGKLTLQ